MASQLRRIVSAAIFALVVIIAATPITASAQQLDIDATFKAFWDYYKQGKYPAAQNEAQKLETEMKARVGTDHPGYAAALNMVAFADQAQGKYAEAEALYQRALVIYQKSPIATSTNVAETLNNLGDVYQLQGKYAEAEKYYDQVLAIREKVLGANHPNLATTLNNLATVQKAQGKYSVADKLLKRALSIYEKVTGTKTAAVAGTLDNMANLYQLEGNYSEAEKLYLRALATKEEVLGVDHPDVATTLNNLAILYKAEGKYGEAERLYKRALAIKEKALGANHPDVAGTIDNLANLYQLQGEYGEAESLYQRALAIKEKALGPNHSDVAGTLNNLADVYQLQGKYGEALPLYQRALAIREKALGANNPEVAVTLNNMAVVYQRQGKFAEAEDLHKRALTIRETALGANHPSVAFTLNNLAGLYKAEGKYNDAQALYQRALSIREKALGASHPDVAMTLNNLALLDAQTGDITDALAYSRKTTAAVIAHAATEAATTQQGEQTGGLVEQRADYFRTHVANLAAAVSKGIGTEPALGQEGFEIAQWAVHSSAAAALQQMAARFSTGNGALAALVRESQDLTVAWREKDKSLVEALAKPESQQNRVAIDQIRKESADIGVRLAANAARLEKDFPDYAALARPKPLPVADVQKLLGPDEAMLFYLTGDTESFVFALTHSGFEWHTLPVSEKVLAEKVTNFRRGLDLAELEKSVKAGQPIMFDLGLAYDMYSTLLAPVAGLIKDKKSLLVVPSGPLTALPFHLLVTEKPAVAKPEFKEIATYRNAAWLLKQYAVTVEPSVASLQALRVYARKEHSTKPMVGFGDPIFRDETAPVEVASAVATNGSGIRPLGGGIPRSKLGDALPRLEDTADELKAVGAKLGAATSDIFLRAAASETNVKRLRLSDYRVVYFATHALLAGEVQGLAEPALVLTIPKQPTDLDDGLLTAGEVAQLKLNADWVVLSACNTMAGDKPGAEALSGLARAFFYAGARALLVSHWAVNSTAATQLTVSTFEYLAANPTLGRTEALRRAMLNFMNDTSSPYNAYPGLWGPFSLIGEGAAS